jgi:hypothetical protein
MGRYKIKVNVELVECDDSEHDLTKEMDGSFSMTISETDAISIDNCEKSVLQTAHPAIREAVSRHLSEISKKKLLEKQKKTKK